MFDIILRVVKVYYCVVDIINFEKELIKTLPAIRRDYVNSITDENRRAQSVYAWKLLEYALNKDYKIKNPEFVLNCDGLWGVKHDNINFSISHSSNIVAVALGDKKPLGIDVERCSNKILKLKNKLITESSNLPDIEALTLGWTKKESLFKSKSGKKYTYKRITDNDGCLYYLTLCADDEKVDFNCVDVNEILY